MTPEQVQQAVEHVDGQHRARARTLSDLEVKLISKRKGQLPKTFDEWCQDMDIVKRVANHVGACQGMNEMRLAVDPEAKVEPPPGPTQAP